MMKKLLLIFTLLLSLVLLGSCAAFDEYVEQMRPIAVAPELTQSEYDFTEKLAELRQATVAITGHTVGEEKTARRGSAVIVKMIEGTLTNTYYAITTQYVVEGGINVTVHVTPTTSVSGLVLNPKLTYTFEEDIALVSFTSSEAFEVVALEKLAEDRNLVGTTVFSIGTPISNAYFNYPSNPAMVMGVYDMRIVHGSNINFGMLGSPLFLKETGELVGINVWYYTESGGRPAVLINEALHINQVIDIVEGYL